MAKRFHSANILTNRGFTDVIEIWDADFSGSSTEFRTRNFYNLNADNPSRQRHEFILRGNLSFTIAVQNSTQYQLITDLKSAVEGRFQIKLTRNGSLRWAGNVVVDIGEVEDISYPNDFTIEATDFGSLVNKEYNIDETTPYTGWATLLEHVVNILGKTNLPTFAWSAGQTMLSTALNWYEDNMATGNDKDPLALARCNHLAFYELQNGGKYKFMPALDVLRNIMLIMGCQIRQSGGRFHIFQISQFETASVRNRHYDNTGAYLSNSLDTYTTIINQTNTGARLAGGKYSWLPQLKKATLRYRHRNWVNLIQGATFNGSPFTTQQIDSGGNTLGLICQFNISRTLSNVSNPTGDPYIERYNCTIKIGNQYLERQMYNFNNGNPLYTPAQWVTTPGTLYEFHFVNNGYLPPMGTVLTLNDYITFTTPALEESGTGTVNVQFNAFVRKSDGEPAGVTLTSFEANGSMLIVDYANGPNAFTDKEYKVTNNIAAGTATVLDLDTQIGDGTTANSVGKIQIMHSGTSVWTDSDSWKIGGSGTGLPLQELMLQQLAAGQTENLRMMRHTVGYTAYEPHQRLDDGTTVWAFLKGEYNAQMDDWTGEWYEVAHSPTTIDVDTSVEVPSGGGLPPITPSTGPVRGPIGGTISFPQVPQIPETPQTPNGGNTEFLLGTLSGGIATSTSLAAGTVTTIPINTILQSGAYQAGQVITVVDTVNGITQEFTVTDTTEDGDTSVAVTGYSLVNIGAGAFVISPQSNGVASGTGNATTAPNSPWWSIFAQHWVIDNSNEFPYPIESPDVVFETAENAGDGSTAGLRFDGDGLQSWTASSATAGVKVGTDGRLYLANLDTATGTVGLVLEGGYVKQKTLPTAGVTDHGALTGLSDDDHSIYALLAGRASGQNIIGGTGSGDNLGLKSTSHGTTGYILVLDDLFLATVGTGTGNQVLILESGVVRQKTLSVITAHSGLSGLSNDDHTQYARLNGRSGGQAFTGGTDAGNSLALQSTTNASRGVITMVDQVQLSNVPTGTGTAGLIIEAGVIKQKTLPTVITAHSGLSGLSNDDHSIYALLAGRSTGQTLIGAISTSGNLTLQSTTSATRGNIIVADQLQLNTVNLAGSSVTQALFLDSGVVKYRTVDNKEYVHLIAVPKGTAVTQTSGFDFNSAVWLVPNGLNGASITRVDYAILNSTATTGSLTVGLDHYNTTNSVVSSNILSATFSGSAVRASNTSTQVLTAGHWMVFSVSSSAGTLNNTVEGLIITIEITK
jgi:hypothetical protein